MNTPEQEIADLRIFSDPFSDTNFSFVDGGWIARFERKGVSIGLRRDSDGKIFSFDSGSLAAGSFRTLLAGPQFAHLAYLAKSLFHEYSQSDDNEMAIPFVVDGNDHSKLSFQQVDSLLRSMEPGSVVGLEGPAGAGKTHFIERLASIRAQQIKMGTGSDPLIIPVRSAGKVLSAIDDRIDGSLSALRSNFNRAEMPVLMRNGLISIAIDGFDELSDSKGYDNSWSALREFLREIGGHGLIILSGRDSFIDTKTLKSLLGSTIDISGAKLRSISIGFPNPDSAMSWLCENNPDWQNRKLETLERFSAYSWLRRPFFDPNLKDRAK